MTSLNSSTEGWHTPPDAASGPIRLKVVGPHQSADSRRSTRSSAVLHGVGDDVPCSSRGSAIYTIDGKSLELSMISSYGSRACVVPSMLRHCAPESAQQAGIRVHRSPPCTAAAQACMRRHALVPSMHRPTCTERHALVPSMQPNPWFNCIGTSKSR